MFVNLTGQVCVYPFNVQETIWSTMTWHICTLFHTFHTFHALPLEQPWADLPHPDPHNNRLPSHARAMHLAEREFGIIKGQHFFRFPTANCTRFCFEVGIVKAIRTFCKSFLHDGTVDCQVCDGRPYGALLFYLRSQRLKNPRDQIVILNWWSERIYPRDSYTVYRYIVSCLYIDR